jgi:translation initiation factor IF-3
MKISKLKVNEQIQARQVIVLGEKGLKPMRLKEALGLAIERSQDLIEILPESPERPPLCRIMSLKDYKDQVKKSKHNPKAIQKSAQEFMAIQAKLNKLIPKRHRRNWTDFDPEAR